MTNVAKEYGSWESRNDYVPWELKELT